MSAKPVTIPHWEQNEVKQSQDFAITTLLYENPWEGEHIKVNTPLSLARCLPYGKTAST